MVGGSFGAFVASSSGQFVPPIECRVRTSVPTRLFLINALSPEIYEQNLRTLVSTEPGRNTLLGLLQIRERILLGSFRLVCSQGSPSGQYSGESSGPVKQSVPFFRTQEYVLLGPQHQPNESGCQRFRKIQADRDDD